MRFILSTLSVAILAVFLGCQSASSSTAKSVEQNNGKTETAKTDAAEAAHENDGDEVERITIEDAKALVDEGKAVIIDARSNNAYNNEHISGSINIPANEFEKRYKEIPKDKKIIVYCS